MPVTQNQESKRTFAPAVPLSIEAVRHGVYFPVSADAQAHYWGSEQIDRLRQIARVISPLVGENPWQDVPEDVNVIITGWGVSERLPKSVWSRLHKLKVIAIFGGSTQCIEDAVEALNKGIVIINTAREIAEGVAEETLGLILASLYEIVPNAVAYKKTGNLVWPEGRISQSLTRSTIGIVGFGLVGQQFAELLRPFRPDLLVYDPYVPQEVLDRHNAKRMELKELLERSEIISVHAGLTSESERMIGKEQLDLIRTGALLVSTSRMRLFDQQALANHIRQGRIRFASDFVPFDPSVWSSLDMRSCSNLVAVPGHTSITTRTLRNMSSRLIEDLSKMFSDEPLTTKVTTEWIRRTT